MYNAAISPLAAIAGVDNGALLTDRLAKKLFFDLLLENYAIPRQAKIPLARIGPFHPDTVSYDSMHAMVVDIDSDVFPSIVKGNLLLNGSGYSR